MRAALAGMLALVTMSGLLVTGASTAQAGPRLAVTGFQGEWSSPALIDRSRHALTTVGVDGVTVRASGASVTTPTADAARQLARANRDGLRGELLVSNYSDEVGDFSEPVAHALLGNVGHARPVARALAGDVVRRGWDGISVDLEALAPRDRGGLTRFVRLLRAQLPRRATLSICVSNFTTPSGYAANGYDLARLAKTVDRVMLMAYDQHGPWADTPGPIGALAWQKKGLQAARRFVPAHKLDLGVAEYAYAWRPHSNDTLSVAQARKLAGSRAHFDVRSGEWTARLADGSTLWWSDARSYARRVALARSTGLHGLAVWDLALGDPIR